VVTTVILMAVIISAADYGLGLVVKQLYSTTTSAAGSQVSAQPSIVSPNAQPSSSASITTPPTSTSGSSAPVTP
jgi:hypothetical protein